MDININVKIKLDESPALINCFAALSETLKNILISTQAAGAQVNAPAPMPVQAPVAVSAPAPAPVTTVVPTTIKKYTLAELQAACAPLMDMGKMAELQNLMAKYNVIALNDIPEERYGELATDLRAMGARL